MQREKYRLQVEELKKQLNSQNNDTIFTPDEADDITKLVNDRRTWEFIYRVISEEGPFHRSHVNQCLLKIFNWILTELKSKNDMEIKPYPYDTLKPGDIDIHQPKHKPDPVHHHPHPPAPLHHHPHTNDFYIPLGIPCRLLNVIYNNEKQKVLDIVSHLFDGPPHEVFMNILSLHVFEQIYTLLDENDEGDPHE